MNLPENFNDFNEMKKGGFLAIKDLKDNGEKIVGVFCTFTPTEIVSAAGATAVGVCGTDASVIPDAEKELPRNLCPLVKSSYGHAMTDTCPYIYFSDMLIGETTCDGKKKMYEMLSKRKPMHIMELPNGTASEQSLKSWRAEMVKLKEFMEDFYDIEITEDDIRKAIKEKNIERKNLKRFYELGKMIPPALHGRKLYSVAAGSKFVFGNGGVSEMLEKTIDSVMEEYEQVKDTLPTDRPRILVTGSPLGAADRKILDTLEELGAETVCYEMCGALRSLDLVDEDEEDVYMALAKKYLNIGCSCMASNNIRIELIEKLIDEYKIDGVVDVTLHACHTFNIESYFIREAALKNKVQFIQIETDYSETDNQQIRTRLEAFVEIL